MPRRSRLEITARRPAIAPHDRETSVDVMVTRAGRLRFAPLLLATTRRLRGDEAPPPRRHAGVDIVSIVLHGSIVHLDERGERHLLGADDIAVRSTGTGIEHGVISHDMCSAVLELWLPGRADTPPRHARRTLEREHRVGRWCTIVGRGSSIATHGEVIVRSIVLPVGASVMHDSHHRSYLVSTVGRIALDGIAAEPDARVTVRGSGRMRITALESTEVVAVTLG